MLTRELILYQTSDGTLTPRFIDPGNVKLLDIAAQLIAVYEDGIGLRREELDEQVLPIVLAHRRTKLLKGLNKLLLDRCKFGNLASDDLSARRMRVFAQSAHHIQAHDGRESLAAHRDAVIGQLPAGDREWAEDCFNDLPARAPLLSFKPLSPRDLLERYNCALPQTLLLFTNAVQLRFTDSRPHVYRQFFAYLKFFRLLASVKKINDTTFDLTIDGPLSLFALTKKYGFNLALLFPAIPTLEKWRLSADIRIPHKRRATLVLDEASHLTSSYHHFAAYIPDEVPLFRASLQEKLAGWAVEDTIDVITLGSQDTCIPDVSLRSSDGRVVHIELFHRWHHAALSRRLKALHKQAPLGSTLMIGVDRFLYKKEMKALLDKSPYFKKLGFLFSGFPSAEHVISLLAP